MTHPRRPSRSRAELEEANGAIRALLDSGVEAHLRALPGVTHVSVGLKERGRAVTDTLAIRVYVREKVAADRLAPDAVVPPAIDGVPTDVIVVRGAEPLQEDFTRHRPVKGGSCITNGIIGLDPTTGDWGLAFGTFGCTATRISDGDVMLLTNSHVLTAEGGDDGDPVYQPYPLLWPRFELADLPVRPIGEENMIARISKHELTPRVDGAIARLDVSSCCRCCGIDWRDEIVGLSEEAVPPSNKLLGLRAAVAGSTVYKSGIRTRRTRGRVVDPDGPTTQIRATGGWRTITGQIEIEGEDDLSPFALRGDSGSVVVDEEGYIVGLVFARSRGELLGEERTYANHIADVCTALGITINLDRSASDTAGTRRTRVEFRPSDADVARYAPARDWLRADPAGAWLWALAESHRDEVVRLVTRHRPVTVAWRRAGGPALLAQGLEALRMAGAEGATVDLDGIPLPAPADGGTLHDALARVGEALHAHGGSRLRADLDAHGDALLAAMRDAATVGDVMREVGERVSGADRSRAQPAPAGAGEGLR